MDSTRPLRDSGRGAFTLIDAHLAGLPFIRLYITDSSGRGGLDATAQDHDYVFAYSHIDFGELEGYHREEKWAQIVDLSGSREDVYARLGQKPRQEINKTYRNDEVTVVVDDPDRSATYDFYCQIKKEDGAVPDFEEDFTGVIWINAYHRDELVATISIYDGGVLLRGKHCVSRRKQEGVNTALMGNLNRRLPWESCAYGIDRGRWFFDMGGLDFETPEKQGITKYKLRFGGEPRRIFVYRHATEAWQKAVAEADSRGRLVF